MNRAQWLGQVIGLALTLSIKVVGLAIVIDELFIQSQTKTIVLVLAGFMMAGAQLTEAGILAFLDRLLASFPTQNPPPAETDTKEPKLKE